MRWKIDLTYKDRRTEVFTIDHGMPYLHKGDIINFIGDTAFEVKERICCYRRQKDELELRTILIMAEEITINQLLKRMVK